MLLRFTSLIFTSLLHRPVIPFKHFNIPSIVHKQNFDINFLFFFQFYFQNFNGLVWIHSAFYIDRR